MKTEDIMALEDVISDRQRLEDERKRLVMLLDGQENWNEAFTEAFLRLNEISLILKTMKGDYFGSRTKKH